jgi:predicted DNA binding CopG/RHH family protein
MKEYIKNPSKANDPLAGDMSDFISKAKWQQARFTFAAKDTTVTLRIPQALVDSAKKIAKKKHIKYQRMMRDAIVDYVVKAG